MVPRKNTNLRLLTPTENLPLLSEEARLFLRIAIQSTEDLDVLFLLRSEPEREWSATDVSDRLRMEPIAVCNRLLSLHLRGLVDHPTSAGPLYRFRYHATSEALEKAADEVLTLYHLQPTAIDEYLGQMNRSATSAAANVKK